MFYCIYLKHKLLHLYLLVNMFSCLISAMTSSAMYLFENEIEVSGDLRDRTSTFFARTIKHLNIQGVSKK